LAERLSTVNSRKVLYISGSLGLGHVVRDLAIANELRKQSPEVGISWLACHPASQFLREAGEDLLPQASLYGNENVPAEKAAATGYRLNILRYAFNARRECLRNVKTFRKAIGRQQFDLIIADEAYEIAFAVGIKAVRIRAPFVMIYDFFGMDAVTSNPIEKLVTYLSNMSQACGLHVLSCGKGNLTLFVGEPEDIPGGRLGLLLPNRREYARANLKFVGYVFPFDPAELTDRAKVRARLGYGKEPLVVCSIGGTAVGKELLELCGRAYPIIKKTIPNLRMVLVCGPRLVPESLAVPKEIDIREYVPALYKHLAASDLAIVQGGGTTTLELTALRRPFLYFPLGQHFEQQVHVAGRLARHQAGIRMSYSETTPALLAEEVISNIGRTVSYPPIPTDGAQKTAQLIAQLL
jgi:predicted glycosyltransferase